MLYINLNNLPKIPRRIATCPICDADLLIDDIDEWESDTGRVTECGLHISCSKEPDIESPEWEGWHKWHYSMPYVDWLPVDDMVYRWFDKNYRLKEEK